MSRKSSMSIALVRIVVLAVLTSLSVRRTFAADNGSPWGANYFPNVPLVTQDGKTVHFYADLLKGKMVVINFIYTKCRDSCPMETAKLAQVQRLLGDRVGRDVFFYSISIDPERDTPAELKEYASDRCKLMRRSIRDWPFAPSQPEASTVPTPEPGKIF
jgi:protein SCO1